MHVLARKYSCIIPCNLLNEEFEHQIHFFIDIDKEQFNIERKGIQVFMAVHRAGLSNCGAICGLVCETVCAGPSLGRDKELIRITRGGAYESGGGHCGRIGCSGLRPALVICDHFSFHSRLIRDIAGLGYEI